MLDAKLPPMPETATNKTPETTGIDAAAQNRRDLRGASECWHFDALSDDGREAIVITFNDNYAFSPRFFREAKRHGGVAADARFPAVTFTYCVDGRGILRAVNEFRAADLSIIDPGNHCMIEKSSFRHNAAEYGSGFVLHIDLLTPRKCRLEADLEWVSIETARSEAAPGEPGFRDIVVPRSDVSGRITRFGRRGKTQKTFHFRGTGFHDHFLSTGAVGSAVATRLSGRAHFVDTTAVIQSYQAANRVETQSRLVIEREGEMIERVARMEARNFRRDRYGMVIPGRLSFVSDDNVRLRVKPQLAIESGFFRKSMVSEITLMLRDGKPRKTEGIVEFTAPGRLRNVALRWFSDLRIGRNGKPPLF